MRRFLLGVVTGVLAVVAGLGAVLLAASEPGGTASPAPSPDAPATAAPSPPRDLRPGETWLASVELDSSAVVTPDGGFRDVHATGRDVRMTAQGLRAGTLRIEATLPSAAARQIGDGVLVCRGRRPGGHPPDCVGAGRDIVARPRAPSLRWAASSSSSPRRSTSAGPGGSTRGSRLPPNGS